MSIRDRKNYVWDNLDFLEYSNDNYYDERNDYDDTPDTTKNGKKNETVDNDEEKIIKMKPGWKRDWKPEYER